MAAALMVMVAWYARRRGYPRDTRFSFGFLGRAFARAFLSLLTPAIIIGGIILVGHADLTRLSLELVLGILAMLFGTLNVAGGFAVTDRMLEMFRKKKGK